MKVESVTPTDAASDPLHPDHDRWVKETTLKMEVEHAKRVGRSLRDAENENAFWLQRAEARARDKPGAEAPKSDQLRKRKTRDERLAERPVVRSFKPERQVTNADLSPCGRCGVCRRCKRERRVYAMAILAKRTGDVKLGELLKSLWLESMQARDLTGKFYGMTSTDANRILIRRLEDICDSTVPSMGEWK